MANNGATRLHADVEKKIDDLVIQLMRDRVDYKVRLTLDQWKEQLRELPALAVARHG